MFKDKTLLPIIITFLSLFALIGCDSGGGGSDTYYKDLDGDGYGNPALSREASEQPLDYVLENTDCNDNDALEHPGQTWYKDADDDGYSESTATSSCVRPAGYKVLEELTATFGDCDDTKASTNPGAKELCGDSLDNNCNSIIDDECLNTVWAWGRNLEGQLGNGTMTSSNTPVQTLELNIGNVETIAAGYNHTVAALKNNGGVWTWGENNHGQFGNDTMTSSNVPVQTRTLNSGNVAAISSGHSHTIALINNGYMWTWGYNGKGQLGDGTNTNSNIPVQVRNLTNAIAVAAGANHSIALE
ncbi:MopE-related protein [Thermodesulfobacteriota bacterium]